MTAIAAPSAFREPIMARSVPLSRNDFRQFRNLQTRWSDNDIYGHMNNVVHYSLFDTAINGWLIELRLLDIQDGTTVGLVVETGCSYFRELQFPQKIEAGIRIGHIGNSSVRYEIGLFSDEADQTAAQGHFVHVYVDRDSRRPVSLAENWRRTLQPFLKTA
jgi:acyl-CoA thioester hydrolase